MRLICGVLRLDGATAEENCLRAMIAEMEVPRLKACVRSWRDGPIALAVLDYSARGEAASGLPEQNGSMIAADVRLDEPEAAQIAVQAAICAPDDVLLLSLLEKHGP